MRTLNWSLISLAAPVWNTNDVMRERERDNYWSHLAHQSDMIASQPHQSLSLADKLERVTARSSLPARVAVADVEAEPD